MTSNSTILGAAAEHYVMCQLLRHGMISALAPAGVPDADIIVSDRIGASLAAVQVKARRNIGSDGGWHMKAKHEAISRPLLFYCFVDFGNGLEDHPKTWVIPSSTVAAVVAASYATWFAAPGKGGRPHKDHGLRRLLPDYGKLTPEGYEAGWMNSYFEKWSLIIDAASQPNGGPTISN